VEPFASALLRLFPALTAVEAKKLEAAEAAVAQKQETPPPACRV
jgi:hypothetical protein